MTFLRLCERVTAFFFAFANQFYKFAKRRYYKSATGFQGRTYANSRHDLKVDILNINFYDWDGNTVYKGGAERYVYDLALLCRNMGLEVNLIQNANRYFEKSHCGLKVIGIPARSGWNFQILSQYYNSHFDKSTFTICSPLDLACSIHDDKQKIIGINHGVYWDLSQNLNQNTDFIHKALFKALFNVKTCVCVDTNFINWTRTCDHGLAEKLTYIPNYYDLDLFKPTSKFFSDEDIVILYPRRLYAPRGFYLILPLIKLLLSKYPNVRFDLVGQADPPEAGIATELMKLYPGRVNWYELDMSEMNKAYRQSQIVVIPTVASEGTSLSCIEALATNNAVVSTTVGGLPNLIISGYNGLLVNPNGEDLCASIEFLIKNRDERSRLAANGCAVASAFSKTLWEKRWHSVLQGVLN